MTAMRSASRRRHHTHHSTMSNASNRETMFEQHRRRLCYLERWRELAIRPMEHECFPLDLDLLHHHGQDDCDELMTRCLEARELMNQHLPPHDTALDDDLVPSKSNIENAGQGLFFRPSSLRSVIQEGEVICYYCGHIHNFHSSKRLQDKSYLMLVSSDILVDPCPLHQIKARYINDARNETFLNCKFVPQPDFYRCAVVATRDILPDEELFVSYGEAYWANQDCEGTIYTGRKTVCDGS